MGIDLILLPLEPGTRDDSELSFTVLSCERRCELFQRIQELEAEPLRVPLSCYVACDNDGATAYGEETEDKYGDPLTAVTVEDLWSLRAHPGVLNHRKNRAVWAYLGELPPERRVVLFWN